MKSIRQSVEAQFNAVEISDAIKLLPIMDAVCASLDKNKELEFRINDQMFVTVSIEHLKEIYSILRNLSFCNSLGKDLKITSQQNNNYGEK